MHVRRDRDSYLVLTVSAFHLNDAPELHCRASRLAIAATTPVACTHFPRRKARVQARPQHAVERQKIGGLRGCHILVLHEASTDSMLMVVQHTVMCHAVLAKPEAATTPIVNPCAANGQ